MKILRLDLLAFGPFTDLSLSLDSGRQGLHVVYGPNEAGKSSSLRALTQLFYGIPHGSTDNFIHPHPNLRIGGLLESAGGTPLEIIRRKGRMKTLRGPDDSEVVDESVLEALVGGVNETTFQQRFGIDYEELRKGGEAVVLGGGDLGEILFAAGAGLADVHDVQARIESEMEELFKQRGSNPRINEATKRLKEARKAMEAAQLSTSEWVQHNAALRSAQTRQSEIEQKLLEARKQKSRLERIDNALPLIDRRQRLGQQHALVADAPRLPNDFATSRSTTFTELSGAHASAREAGKAIDRLQDEISRLNVPQELLAHRTAITRLHTDLGGYQKAAKDRPGLVARLEATEKRAQEILQELGREPKLEAAEPLRLNRADRQRIQSLAADCKARIDQQRSAEKAVRKLSEEIQRVESELAALRAYRDASDLASAIRAAGKHGDLDQQLRDARTTLNELERQTEVELERLCLWSGTLEDLERLAVPASETIDRFANQLADAEAQVARCEERIDEWTRLFRTLQQGLERLRLEHDVPTEDDLTRARRRRDEGWHLVQDLWHGKLPDEDPAVLKFLEDVTPGEDLAQAFAMSVKAADAVADRLRREADRVAELARLTADRQNLERRIDEQQESLHLAQKERERLTSQWREQWTGLEIEPLPPREMRSWLDQQKDLAETARKTRQHRRTVEATENLVQSLRADLNRRLEELGEPQEEKSSALSAILDRCENFLHKLDAASRTRQGHQDRLQVLRDNFADAQQNAKQAGADLQSWQNDWAQAVSALGLDRDASPSTANSVIESVDELFALLKNIEDLQGRIDGIDREAEAFQDAVNRLLELVDRELLQLPVDQALGDLYDRLVAASTAQTKREGYQDQLQKEKSKRDRANAQIEQLQAAIDAMCRLAGCASPDDLPVAEQRSAARARLELDLASVEDQLVSLAAGTPLETFISEAREFHPDQVRADLAPLNEQIAELDRERAEVAEATGRHREALARMDGSGRAAEAQEEAEHLLARIRSDAEQYIRLRLASFVLRRAIDRYREASKGPVLARASELFAQLTLGAFTELRADFDDNGKAVLAGIRAGGGQMVHVDGMSDGTCDQLYLALRLALLESCLVDREPLPFIVDDILVMFDDERAVAALKAFAELSHKTQVIFFTHHEHLVELARQHLPPECLFVHCLRNGRS